jgi:hypothetical protein
MRSSRQRPTGQQFSSLRIELLDFPPPFNLGMSVLTG